MITCDFGSMIQDQRAQLTFTIPYRKRVYTEFSLATKTIEYKVKTFIKFCRE